MRNGKIRRERKREIGLSQMPHSVLDVLYRVHIFGDVMPQTFGLCIQIIVVNKKNNFINVSIIDKIHNVYP